MRPIYHIIVSICLGLAVFALTQSFLAFIIIILTGVFIDLDHLVDFWATRPKNPLSIKDFLDSERYNKQAKYMFVFLHGYEWLIALIILNYIFGWPLLLASAMFFSFR